MPEWSEPFPITPKEAEEIMKKRQEAKQSGQKRKADVASAYAPDDDVYSEYRCPITQELPVDPVTAQDGHTYERTAIEDWLERAKDGEAKSPMTNEFMGKTVVPALQMRNAIERLIGKGVISGEAARTWTEKQAELQAIDKDKRPVLAKAHKGDLGCMRTIGFCYRDGSNGFKLNIGKAREWFSKAAVHEDAHAIVSLGIFHLNGTGVPKDPTRGMLELTRAAYLGSEHGAITLANELASGEHFKQKDETEATRWYQFSRKCKCKDSVATSRERRDDWLKARGLLSQA
jgi:TPR repeat protein